MWGYFGLLVNRYFASFCVQICSRLVLLVHLFCGAFSCFQPITERLAFCTSSTVTGTVRRCVWSDAHSPGTALDSWFLKWVLFFGTQVQNLPYCLPSVALQASECWGKAILSSQSLVKVGCKEIGLFFLLFSQDLNLLCIWERKRRLALLLMCEWEQRVNFDSSLHTSALNNWYFMNQCMTWKSSSSKSCVKFKYKPFRNYMYALVLHIHSDSDEGQLRWMGHIPWHVCYSSSKDDKLTHERKQTYIQHKALISSSLRQKKKKCNALQIMWRGKKWGPVLAKKTRILIKKQNKRIYPLE